jgi:hypothetical protein
MDFDSIFEWRKISTLITKKLRDCFIHFTKRSIKLMIESCPQSLFYQFLPLYLPLFVTSVAAAPHNIDVTNSSQPPDNYVPTAATLIAAAFAGVCHLMTTLIIIFSLQEHQASWRKWLVDHREGFFIIAASTSCVINASLQRLSSIDGIGIGNA